MIGSVRGTVIERTATHRARVAGLVRPERDRLRQPCALLRDGQLVFVDALALETPKSKDMRGILDAVVGAGSTALVLLSERNENVERSITNLHKSHYLRVNYLNMRDLLQYDKVVVPLDALEVIKSLWGQE